MNRIVILDSNHGDAIPDMNEIFKGTIFIHAKENQIQNTLCSAIRKLNFSIKSYQARYNFLIDKKNNPELQYYIDELNNIDTQENDQEIELEDTRLSYYFKTYLVLVKSVLDKTVPFINYRYKFDEKTFESRGDKLLIFLRKKYKGHNAGDLIKLIEENKADWLDGLLTLRDNFVHYSNLNDYKDFSIILNTKTTKIIKDLDDFERPHILYEGIKINALDFLNQTHYRLKIFLNNLLIGFEFNIYHKPDFVTKCNKCDFQFAEIVETPKGRSFIFYKPLAIMVYNKEYEHGLIACPNCDKEFEVSLTRLKEFGLGFETDK